MKKTGMFIPGLITGMLLIVGLLWIGPLQNSLAAPQELKPAGRRVRDTACL